MPTRAQLVGPRLTGRCGGCGDALDTDARLRGRSWCGHCRLRWGVPPPPWDAVAGGCDGWAAASYRGPVRRAVLAAKRGSPAAAAQLLAQRAERLVLPVGAVVTWVPAHPRRALLAPDAGQTLAAAVADVHNLQLQRLVRRWPWGRRQAGREAAARRSGAQRLGFALRVQQIPEVVVLVDDVRTTGATLDHVAGLLRAAGARRVIGVVVALAVEP